MIAIEPVTPLRTDKVFAFVNRGEDYRTHTQEYVDHPVYPEPLVNIRQIRVARGISLREAANRLGLSVAQVSGLERGQFRPVVEVWTRPGDTLPDPTWAVGIGGSWKRIVDALGGELTELEKAAVDEIALAFQNRAAMMMTWGGE